MLHLWTVCLTWVLKKQLLPDRVAKSVRLYHLTTHLLTPAHLLNIRISLRKQDRSFYQRSNIMKTVFEEKASDHSISKSCHIIRHQSKCYYKSTNNILRSALISPHFLKCASFQLSSLSLYSSAPLQSKPQKCDPKWRKQRPDVSMRVDLHECVLRLPRLVVSGITS